MKSASRGLMASCCYVGLWYLGYVAAEIFFENPNSDSLGIMVGWLLVLQALSLLGRRIRLVYLGVWAAIVLACVYGSDAGWWLMYGFVIRREELVGRTVYADVGAYLFWLGLFLSPILVGRLIEFVARVEGARE